LHSRHYSDQVSDDTLAFLRTYLPSATGLGSSPTGAGAPPGPVGYLEGRATFGPLRPVEIAGVPPPTPTPETCTARGLIISDAASGAEVAKVGLDADCTFRVALPPGAYRVLLKPSGMDRSQDLPRDVQLVDGQTVRLDISIDKGIR